MYCWFQGLRNQFGDFSDQQTDTDNVNKIMSEHKNLSDVIKIKETVLKNFDLPKASPKDINKIIKSLNS